MEILTSFFLGCILRPKKTKRYRLWAEIESCFLKSPKLWAFSRLVEHLTWCQFRPKASTVAALDFGPVGTLAGGVSRGAHPVGLWAVVVAVAVAARPTVWQPVHAVGAVWPSGHGADDVGCPGPRWRGGAVVYGPSGPWPDTPGEVVGGGIQGMKRPAGLSCHETP